MKASLPEVPVSVRELELEELLEELLVFIASINSEKQLEKELELEPELQLELELDESALVFVALSKMLAIIPMDSPPARSADSPNSVQSDDHTGGRLSGISFIL